MLEPGYTVVELDQFYFYGIEAKGPFMETAPKTWKAFKATPVPTNTEFLQTVFVLKPEPIYRAGVQLSKAADTVPEGFVQIKSKGGLYAKFVLRGSYSQLPVEMGNVMKLAHQKEDVDECADYIERYTNNPENTAEQDLITEIYVPLKNTITIKVEGKVKTTPKILYDTLLDRTKPGSIWYTVKDYSLDVKVGGLFYHCVEFGGNRYPHYGKFVELKDGEKVSMRWMSSSTKGLDSLVTFTFTPSGAETLVVIEHEGLPNCKMGKQHKDGWNFMIDSFHQVFK
ncbi:hypothetical protein HDV01_000972 [Terramyces sp. JEL0728]|nr:hypothetical protein HDV01_000972 [Terramyces sp. JEL0728]